MPKKQKLKTIVEQINKENAPPDGWRKEDAVPKDPGPRPGKVYALTGGPGTACIAAGNTWEESVVKEKDGDS
jgi:hypothetical protein